MMGHRAAGLSLKVIFLKRSLAFSLSLTILLISPLLLVTACEILFDSPQPAVVTKAAPPDPTLTRSVNNDQPLPDRLIVRFQPQTAAPLYFALRSAVNFNSTLVGNRLSRQDLNQKVPELADLFNRYKVRAADAIDPLGGTYLFRTYPGSNLQAMSEALQASQTVAYTEFDYPVHAFKDASDPIYQSGQQWGLTQIDAQDAWNITTGSSKVTIAIVDSGVGSHPELSGRILNGWNFASDPASPDSSDDNGHGTYVAGIAAAKGDNGQGIAGIDWNALILPVKVLNKDGIGSNATIAMGIHYAADQGAQVINLSLGGTNRSRVVQEAVNYATYPLNANLTGVSSNRNGAVLIAAAGNNMQSPPANATTRPGQTETENKPNYPAAYDEVIAVGATDGQDLPTAFSAYGPELSICAPGYSIISLDWNTTDNSPAYSYGSGTSSAAPFVSGTVALMLSVNSSLSGNEIRNILEGTTDYKAANHSPDLSSTPTSAANNGVKALAAMASNTVVAFDGRSYDLHQGWGRLNTFKAVQAASNNQTFPARRSRVEGFITGIAINGQPGIDPGSVIVQLSPGDQRVPDANGFYSFRNLPPGSYKLQAISTKYGLTSNIYSFQVEGIESKNQNFDFSEVSNLLFSGQPVGAFAPIPLIIDHPNSEDWTYFPQTQHTLSNAFKHFWDKNGGVDIFGYPISEEFVENGRTVQYFERAVFEYHSELAGTPAEVQLTLLGNQQIDATKNQAFKAIPFFSDTSNRKYFPFYGGHSLSTDFLVYWQQHNGSGTNGYPAILGYPISEPFTQQDADGKTYTAQYFERAELKLYPGSTVSPAHVELSLLGKMSAQKQGLIGK